MQDDPKWVLRTMRRILAESGPKTARRFLDSRGGSARYEAAARELARYNSEQQPGKSFSRSLSSLALCWWICRDLYHHRNQQGE